MPVNQILNEKNKKILLNVVSIQNFMMFLKFFNFISKENKDLEQEILLILIDREFH